MNCVISKKTICVVLRIILGMFCFVLLLMGCGEDDNNPGGKGNGENIGIEDYSRRILLSENKTVILDTIFNFSYPLCELCDDTVGYIIVTDAWSHIRDDYDCWCNTRYPKICDPRWEGIIFKDSSKNILLDFYFYRDIKFEGDTSSRESTGIYFLFKKSYVEIIYGHTIKGGPMISLDGGLLDDTKMHHYGFDDDRRCDRWYKKGKIQLYVGKKYYEKYFVSK